MHGGNRDVAEGDWNLLRKERLLGKHISCTG